jgi:hypothetical protein
MRTEHCSSSTHLLVLLLALLLLFAQQLVQPFAQQ